MHRYAVCSTDLNTEPMTLIYELDIDILNIDLHTEKELSTSMLSKVRALWTDKTNGETDRQTGRQTDIQTDVTENNTTPHSRVITQTILFIFKNHFT